MAAHMESRSDSVILTPTSPIQERKNILSGDRHSIDLARDLELVYNCRTRSCIWRIGTMFMPIPECHLVFIEANISKTYLWNISNGLWSTVKIEPRPTCSQLNFNDDILNCVSNIYIHYEPISPAGTTTPAKQHSTTDQTVWAWRLFRSHASGNWTGTAQGWH